MKRLFSILAITGLMTFGNVQAQDSTQAAAPATEQVADTTAAATTDEAAATTEEAVAEEATFTQSMKKRFIEGDPIWMSPVLLCLILGLAIAIERIIYLNLSTINTKKFVSEVENALNSGGIEAAKEVAKNTAGPVASIFYQGLERSSHGLESAEKSIVAYGGVQMGQLEKNVSWVSLFIALAPMLGFLGTVIGMIVAFDQIGRSGRVAARSAPAQRTGQGHRVPARTRATHHGHVLRARHEFERNCRRAGRNRIAHLPTAQPVNCPLARQDAQPLTPKSH